MHKDRLALTILFVAFLARFVGVWYGLPALYNSDEPFNVVNALAYGAKGSLAPTYHVYPAFYSYLLLAVYGIYYLAGLLFGFFENAIDFGAAYFLNPAGLFWTGRLLSVCLGVGTVALVLVTGRHFFSKRTGYLAAALLGFSFAHADLSHWILPEAAVAFVTSLALFFVFRSYREASFRSLVLAGLISGIAISTKYNAGFVVLPLILAAFWRFTGSERYKAVGASLLSLLAGFVGASPYWVLSFHAYWQDLAYTVSHVRTGMVGHFADLPGIWPLWQLLVSDWSIGLVLVTGFFSLFFRKERESILLAALVVPTVVIIGFWSRTGIYYLVPVLPALALAAGHFLSQIPDRKMPVLAKTVFLGAVFLPALIKIGLYDIRLMQEDSRTVAQQWIEANIPARSSIAYENYVYGPNLFDPGRYFRNPDESRLLPLEIRELLVEESLRRISFQMVNLRKDFRLKGLSESAEATRKQDPYVAQLLETRLPKLSSVAAAGISYLLISSDNYARYFTENVPEKGTPLWLSYQNGRRFYESAMQSEALTLLKTFEPDYWRLGPTIKIYQFRPQGPTEDGP